jgi:hypothetical protein
MSDLLKWAEEAGLENLRFRLQNTETLAREATTTLTIVFAALGGVVAYAIKGLESSTVTPLTAGATVCSLWLMVVGFLLVHCCLKTSDFQTPTNEPHNLYKPAYTLAILRELELNNIQARIVVANARNERTAVWLDRCRYCVLCAPIAFAVGALARHLYALV